MVDLEKAEKAVTMLLEAIGEDPSRPGLLETPRRVARMYSEITAGYEDSSEKHLSKIFDSPATDIVLEKDITFFSTCEHHLLPFFGKAHVAYIPEGKVVGLSKLARAVDTFARRLQLQEQMTNQVADSIDKTLSPKGVMIVVEAEHTCMTMRGIKKVGSKTVTIATRGCFVDNYPLQQSVRDMIG